VDVLRRAKSLRIEAKAGKKARRWQAKDLAIVTLFGAACGVLMLTRFLLCNYAEMWGGVHFSFLALLEG
jgi:hypothetical protein